MCGIVGYVGDNEAAPILLDGLKKLEYRGYDSAGLAVRNKAGETAIVKATGKIAELSGKTDEGKLLPGTEGIGHTRWATHGEPNETNAHPHKSDDGNVIGVHNGIIENYQELKAKLIKNGYEFYSNTDTEVIIKLIDYYYKKYFGTPVDAINRALVRTRGSYALAIMFKDYPGEIYAARKESPMVCGLSEDGAFLASDVAALIKHTRKVYYLGNLELAKLTKDNISFYDLNGDEINKEISEIDWSEEATEKGGYEHFMMKEIHEQPKAITDTLNAYVRDGDIDLSNLNLEDDELKNTKHIYIVACGSAYHAGMVGKYVIEKMSGIPVEVEYASEFRYRDPVLLDNSLVIVISQSGETADSLAALRLAKDHGLHVIAIVNVVGSAIAREANHVMYTYAGPEIAVATTKAYSAQLICLYVLAIKIALINNKLTVREEKSYIEELTKIPGYIDLIIDDKERIQWFASQFANTNKIFFIGRGIDYAIGLEGSLKTKEISYIHSEAYAAGELKHGTISLIENGTLVIGIETEENLYEKTTSNMVEVKARGAYLMGLTAKGNYSIEQTADFTVYVPKISGFFMASLAIVPLQLLAYYISLAKGLDVDKPRNLAKSVTVE